MTPVVGFRALPTADPKLRLDVLNREDCQTVREWRNTHLEGLRTPFPLTEEQQDVFYDEIVCDRSLPLRYWAVRDCDKLVGMVGLTDIDFYARSAEVSLITDPDSRMRGYGSGAFDLLLHQAFDMVGLETVFGECYECNPAVGFWRRMAEKYGAYVTTLPRRKRWAGKLWDSMYFSIENPNTACKCGGGCDDGCGSEGPSE